MREIIITTTNSISGTEIEKYLGLVTTNLVIGTNVFSDFDKNAPLLASNTTIFQFLESILRADGRSAPRCICFRCSCVVGSRVLHPTAQRLPAAQIPLPRGYLH